MQGEPQRLLTFNRDYARMGKNDIFIYGGIAVIAAYYLIKKEASNINILPTLPSIDDVVNTAQNATNSLISQAQAVERYSYLSAINLNPNYGTNPSGYIPDVESGIISNLHNLGLDTFGLEKTYYETHNPNNAVTDAYYGIVR